MPSKKVSAKKTVIKKTPETPVAVVSPKKEIKYVKLPLIPAVLLILAVAGLSFYLGSSLKLGNKTVASDNKSTFAATKSDKPELDFYVMSFCPYGNQMETALKPVFDLIGDKATIQPHYIFEKIGGNLADYCKQNMPDPANCETYVKNSQGQLKDVNDCKKQIAQMVTECNDEKQYLKIGNNYYSSLHGRVEANQDVREICAYNLADNKKAWWDFVANVNQNCTVQNADTCWEDQAKKAGLDTAKITDCFNKDAASLIDKEIELTNKNQVQGSPTLFVNGQAFPPESAYTADGKGTLTIGKKSFTQDQFRNSDTIKEAICASFKKAPAACKTEISEPKADTAASANTDTASCN